MNETAKHDDWLFQQLQDAEFAAEYLNAANEDDDPKTYLAALRKVGVPYTDEEIAKAAEDVTGKTELEAVIAYLQGLGLALK